MQHGHHAGKAPTKDNLLVFYIADKMAWELSCKSMVESGCKNVKSYNPYWDINGNTFEDIDGYRVVLENSNWKK